MLEIGYSYHLKDELYKLIDDKYMMANKENGGYRPHYYAIQDSENKSLYWMIPISSQYNKYQKIYNTKFEKYGKCDTLALGKFAGKLSAYLIQNSIPITSKYVDHIHTIETKPVTIHKKLHKELQSKLKTCLALNKRGIRVFYTDVDRIREILLEIERK